MNTKHRKFSRLARVVCLITVLAMLLSSCEILNRFIGGESPDVNEPAVCTDADQDHLCDDCGAALSECADQNGDHKCDICAKVISTCQEGENHCCDGCGAIMSVCIDEDRNHGCDICNKPLDKCADEDRDHNCDASAHIIKWFSKTIFSINCSYIRKCYFIYSRSGATWIC